MEGKGQTRQTAVQWSRVNHRHNILHFATFKYDNSTSCTSSVLAVLAYLSNNNWHLNPSKGDGQKIGRLCPLFQGGGWFNGQERIDRADRQLSSRIG